MANISKKIIYSSLLSLVIHAESIRWNRFNNFLMVNSIMLLSWATIYTYKTGSLMRTLVLILICCIGALSGLLWAGLGLRSSIFHFKYVQQISDMETDDLFWPIELENYKIFIFTKKVRDNMAKEISNRGWFWIFLAKRSHSFFILRYVPLFFSLFYLILLLPSWTG